MIEEKKEESAWVKLYHPCGALVTLPLPLAGEEIEAIFDSVSLAIKNGFFASPPSENPDEKIEDVSGWIKGETSDGRPCVYLYPANPALEYKLVTVWEEDIGNLPFAAEVAAADALSGTPPKRQSAVNDSRYHPAAGQVVLKADGVNKEGKPRFRFARWLGVRGHAPDAHSRTADETSAAPRLVTADDLIKNSLVSPENARRMMEALKLNGLDVIVALRRAFIYRAWIQDVVFDVAVQKALDGEVPPGSEEDLRRFLKNAVID